MIEAINEVKTILLNNFTINHDFVGGYEDFIPESHPAICIEPNNFSAVLGNALNYDDFNEDDNLSVWYIDEAPQDRDKTAFITKVDEITGVLMNNPRLNEKFNLGIGITVEYTSRSTEDNIEFIAKITIEGRNV